MKCVGVQGSRLKKCKFVDKKYWLFEMIDMILVFSYDICRVNMGKLMLSENVWVFILITIQFSGENVKREKYIFFRNLLFIKM